MEDDMIVGLFWDRDERAIAESKTKYGRYCRHIAMRILNLREDAEEAESDTYLRAWETIPPNRPESLMSYLGAICRQIAIDKLKRNTRLKRGGGEFARALEELGECVADERNSGDFTDKIALRDALNAFLSSLPDEARRLFMQRYWWSCSINEIASEHGMTESAVKMSLLRSREQLREHLQKEGFEL